ncbi:DISARM system helicase DrmA [Micromonospora ureilytica]|uniref:DISARM system helicase DrmA n=1 Tax=Micromonospora ureilytica TaxID=709868 RepID=UPI002E10CA80|nr:DISARM system helicase DrmA [Micromonospora ureilytica]
MVEVQGGLFPHPRGEQQALTMPSKADADQQALIPPLDVPQTFPEATSFQVRDELEELIGRDLLGPWDGEQEEFRPGAMGPRERYLVGMLGPKQRPRSDRRETAEVADVDSAVQGDGAEAELPEVVTPQNLGKMWASSMGLSFAVPGDVDVLTVTADWGRYDLRESEDEKGKKRRVWYREPVSYRKEVRLDSESSYRMPLTVSDEDEPGVHLAVEVRPRDGRRVVQLALINTQQEATSNGDTAWLFQAALTVTALDGDAAVFLPIDDPLDGVQGVGDDLEETHLRLLYRSQRRYASGRNIAVHPSVREDERCAYQLATTWLPTHNVPATVAQVGKDSGLAGVALSMDALATADIDRLRTRLAPLADGYEDWLDNEEAKIPNLPEPLRPAAVTAVFNARRAAERIRAGIALLTDPETEKHADAIAAFRFANEAMALQRRHSEVARLREEQNLSYADAKAAIDARGAAAASWRPFQLAFVLLNLPSITDPAHPERAADRDATVDLLFFPTGGGKTEAYLGLTAFTFAIRRLQGVVGAGADARSGAGGVAVLMRYTLRLLTAQQFQRAAALVCAAEVLRRQAESIWGAEPFRIGLWVGGGVSPNWFTEASEQIAEAREAGSGKFTNVLQTLGCPWCGSKLRAERDLTVREDERRVLVFCPEAEGADACPFSRTRSTEGLPILTIDEEIYRYAPSLVIATVDKLAQLPWRGFAGMLFGRVRERCPRHGYRHDDLDAKTGCGARHNKKSKLPAVASEPVVRLRPPDLIIQDELHLISGALGTIVGLFEAAVDQLCTWSLPDGGEAGPKIVASTATTKRAREQVLGVFGRQLAVFPPPVIDITDTFFSRQVSVTVQNPGRRYLGICAHGVRMKSAEIRVAEILLIAGQTLFDTYGQPADPYMTTVGYFSATRELAGMRRLLDDQVTTRVRSHGRRKGLSDRIAGTQMLNVQELTSRVSSADISEVLKRLENGFGPELDTTARRRAVLEDMRDAFKAKTASNPKLSLHPVTQSFYQRQDENRVPVDAVLATSMLQVGVDVSRFGLMVVTGQPKNTAEYIQASSRVGRDAKRPGLVVTLYNWTRPRDLAHYEDFEYYHATFYRQVEALSVTPYTRRALDRGTTATLVAAVRNGEDAFSRNTDAHDVPLDGPEVQRVIGRLLARAEAISGTRGRDYLQERINRLRDRWNEKKTGSSRLGYSEGTFKQQKLAGLLTVAGGGRWTDLTVGQSMRETENEINLVLPAGGEIFNPQYGTPEWSFGPQTDSKRAEDLPDGDELGESTLTGKGN